RLPPRARNRSAKRRGSRASRKAPSRARRSRGRENRGRGGAAMAARRRARQNARGRRGRDAAVTIVREWPGGAVAACRIVNACLCLAIAAYCVLSYSPFAYGMFIKPDVVPALSDFTALSPWLFLVTLLLTTLSLMPQLRGAAGRNGARAYVAAGAGAAVWLFAVRPLPALGNTPRALAMALAALVPPLWLAAIDHRAHRQNPIVATDR